MELPERACLFCARWAVGRHVVGALALFLGLYVLGHQEATSDVPAYYLRRPLEPSLRGDGAPFRDFMSSYAPLFPYVGAILVAAWNSGKVFALFAMTLNVITLLMWHFFARDRFDQRITRSATVLYATSGHVLVQGLLGTNQPWIGVALAASALLILRDRPVAAGLVQAGAACATKVLAHLFWPVFWICAPERSRWLLAAILPTAAVYLVFVALGAGPQLLHPLQYEGGRMSSGNLLYLLDLFLGIAGPSERLILDGLTATACAGTLGWLYLRTRSVLMRDRPALLPAALALAGLTLVLFSKKSFTGYVIFVMYPLVLMAVAGTRRRVAFLMLFNVLLVVEPSLWFHLDGFNRSLRTWIDSGSGNSAAGFVCLDLALLGCYVYLAWLSVRWVLTTVDGAIADRKASQSTTACSLV